MIKQSTRSEIRIGWGKDLLATSPRHAPRDTPRTTHPRFHVRVGCHINIHRTITYPHWSEDGGKDKSNVVFQPSPLLFHVPLVSLALHWRRAFLGFIINIIFS